MYGFIQIRPQLVAGICTWALLGPGIGLCMEEAASTQGLIVSEQTFGCILDWPKVRNTRIQHVDPEKLKEAMRILRDSVPDKDYPVGTILQLVPFEAMVKHPREKFPKSNGWEFFALEVLEGGTTIRDRGDDNVVNLSLGTAVSTVISLRRSLTSCVKRDTAVPPFLLWGSS